MSFPLYKHTIQIVEIVKEGEMRLIDADEISVLIEEETDCRYMTCQICKVSNPSLYKVCQAICDPTAGYEPEEEETYDDKRRD